MTKRQSDKIFIKDFLVRIRIGIDEVERATETDVLINIIMYTDTTKAAKTNDLGDAIDYRQIHGDILALVRKRPFVLIEHLAQEIADMTLAHPLIQTVQVTIEKPSILKYSKSAGVEIVRRK